MNIPEGSCEYVFQGRRLTAGRVETHPAIREWYVSWLWGDYRHLVALTGYRGRWGFRHAVWAKMS